MEYNILGDGRRRKEGMVVRKRKKRFMTVLAE